MYVWPFASVSSFVLKEAVDSPLTFLSQCLLQERESYEKVKLLRKSVLKSYVFFFSMTPLNACFLAIKLFELLRFVCLFVCLFGLLTSSSTARLYRGRAPRQSV